MNKLYSLLLVVLLIQHHLNAQDLDRRVSMRFTEVPLQEMLREVGERYGISFSYGGHLQALDQQVSVTVTDMPMGQFLLLVLEPAGLTYKVLGGNVVLRVQEQKQDTLVSIARPAVIEGRQAQQQLLHKEEILLAVVPPRLERMEAIWMKLPLPEWGIPQGVSLEKIPPAVKQKPSAFSLGPVFSLDVARLDLKGSYAVNQQLIPDLGLSLGGAGFWKLSDRLFVEMYLLYSRKGFTVAYLMDAMEEPLGIPERSEIELSYVEVPLGVDFSLIRHKRLRLYGLSGLFGSYLLTKGEKTWLDDGRMFPTTTMHIPALSTFLWGVQGGVNLQYLLKDKLLFFITPVYQYTINSFKKGTQHIRLQEFKVRTGLKFSL
jgi:hypothetical protein